MNDSIPAHLEFTEPERYELHEPPPYRFEVDRRGFMQTLGAGLLISVAAGRVSAQRAGRRSGAPGPAQRLHLAPDGRITVFTSKVEVGQGSRTQLTMAAAEELRVPIERVSLVMADSAQGPDDGGTAGSRTTPSTVPSVRRGCAAARQLLIQTAAQKFQTDAAQLKVVEGRVLLPAGRSFGYADLAALEEIPQWNGEAAPENALTPHGDWRVLGKTSLRVGARDVVTGAHRYPSDMARPGMLHGKILRPPTDGADLEAIDLEPARSLAGVTAVRDGDFVGFAAATSWAATRARDAAGATARWTKPDRSSSETLADDLRARVSDQRPRRNERGTPDAELGKAVRRLKATYFIPYVQHAPMEPRAAVAEWDGDRLTVWTGTQQPGRVRDELARAFRLDAANVRLIVPDTGGGFGGKHSGEAAVEAARLAKAAGKPVSLCWSREEEFTHAYFRPAGVMDLEGGLTAQGELTAWTHLNILSGASAIDTPYEIPHVRTEYRGANAPLRSGSYRALASAANTFARESFMDELAKEAGSNPLDFRLNHRPIPRLKAVLEAAAKRFDWERRWQAAQSPQPTGVGLACGTEKGSYTAACVEIAFDKTQGTYRIVQVVQTFECGALHNPGNVVAQVEGAIIQGLGPVLSEEIRFAGGVIRNPKFSQYRVPRMRDVPRIETVLLDRPDLPSVGAGETPIIALAPAVANAICHATQLRLRSLPLRHESLRPA